MATEHLYLRPGEGERVSLQGTKVVFKASGARAGGGPTVLEFITAPGFSTRNHMHRTIEEIFCVLDGEFDIRAGERRNRVGSGSLVAVNRAPVEGAATDAGVHACPRSAGATASRVAIMHHVGIVQGQRREYLLVITFLHCKKSTDNMSCVT